MAVCAARGEHTHNCGALDYLLMHLSCAPCPAVLSLGWGGLLSVTCGCRRVRFRVGSYGHMATGAPWSSFVSLAGPSNMTRFPLPASWPCSQVPGATWWFFHDLHMAPSPTLTHVTSQGCSCHWDMPQSSFLLWHLSMSFRIQQEQCAQLWHVSRTQRSPSDTVLFSG